MEARDTSILKWEGVGEIGLMSANNGWEWINVDLCFGKIGSVWWNSMRMGWTGENLLELSDRGGCGWEHNSIMSNQYKLNLIN